MKDRRWAWSAVITAVYAVTVTWAAALHEPWRDEVVPLSIARRAHSLAELAAPLRFESHPIGWYLLLWGLWALVGRVWVLKAASLGAAVGATFLVNRSPLPWWLAGLFTFSFFPLYQYSVISRGYGLEMVVLFVFCALHPARRAHPVVVALVLAALANTEAFGLIMAVAAGVMLAAEGAMGGSAAWRRLAADRWVQGAVALYGAGLLAATLVSFPDPSHRGTGIRHLELWDVVRGVGRAIAEPAAHSGAMTIVPMPSLWIWGYFAYLTRTPPLFCFAAVALVGIEVLFNLVPHLRAAWHVGNVLLVLVAAIWLDAAAAADATPATPLARGRTWLGRLLSVGLCVVLAHHVVLAATHLATEARYDYSSNRRLAEVLQRDPALADAVVMGEPDGPLWSLPYYADHRIYLGREERFRDWGTFAPPRRSAYDLGALLASARRVREACACPIVLTLGFEVGQLGIHTSFRDTLFEETFEITAPQRDEFVGATRLLASLREPVVTDERYDVFVLR